MKKTKRKPHNWTKEQDDFLSKNVVGIQRSLLTEMLNEEFGLNLGIHQIKSRLKILNLSSGLDGRFKKGDIPYSRGKTWG